MQDTKKRITVMIPANIYKKLEDMKNAGLALNVSDAARRCIEYALEHKFDKELQKLCENYEPEN